MATFTVDGQSNQSIAGFVAGTDLLTFEAADGTAAYSELIFGRSAGGDLEITFRNSTVTLIGLRGVAYADMRFVRDFSSLAGVIDNGDVTQDVVTGSPGQDTLRGGAGDDHLDGAGDNDKLVGQWGNDSLIGGEGDDVLNGGRGNDILDGGPGKDLFLPGAEIDTITTGSGRDTITIDEDDGTVIITDFTRGEDKINVRFLGESAARFSDLDFSVIGNDTHVTYGATTVIFENLTTISKSDFRLAGQTGNGGNNTLTGTDFDDNIYGRAGNDTLNGLDGADYILGEGGMDIIDGGAVRDNLHGGRQDDQVSGGAGNDFISGGHGDDRLEGGLDNDSLLGGSGNDTFIFTLAGGRDKVRDFTQGEDLLDVSGLGIRHQAEFDSMGAVSGGYELVSGDVTIFLQGFSGTLTDADFVFAESAPLASDDALNGNIDAAIVPISGDIQVNTFTNNNQVYPSVAALENGGFVVTWSSAGQDGSGYGIFAQRYDNAGVAVGSEFQVNTFTNGSQRDSSVAALDDGGFVVSWASSDQDGSERSVYAQRYNSSGIEVGAEFRVNTFTDIESFQLYPSVAALEDGGFVITWESWDQDGSDMDIFAQRFDPAGAAVGVEFQVNTFASNNQDFPSVAALNGGGFVVTWSSWFQDGSSYGVYAQRYDSAGDAVGSEFQVNTSTNSSQVFSSVAALADGGFVVTWGSVDQDGSGRGIYAQRYNGTGVAVGSEFRVNTFTDDDQLFSGVAALEDGGFVVTWSSDGQDSSSYGIYAQRYDADGIPVGEETRLNEITAGSQTAVTPFAGEPTAVLADGTLVSTWGGVGNEEVFVRLFDLPDGTATDEDTPLTIDDATLLANDTDADGDALTITSVDGTSASGAAVSINAEGDVVYDPTNAATIQALSDGETLEDSFVYTVSDGNGGTDTATVTIVVGGLDEPAGPEAVQAPVKAELEPAPEPLDLYTGPMDEDQGIF